MSRSTPPSKLAPRAPQQERSRKRRDAIVDAAADLFADELFPAVTMEAIAKHASAPIGSVYQFFADKRAVFAAVMERSNQRATETFDALLQPTDDALDLASIDWRDAIDLAVDGFAALQASEPSIRASNRNVAFMGELLDNEEALQRTLSRRTAKLLGVYFPKAAPARRRLVATMVVDLSVTFLVLADRRQGAMARAQLTECKKLVKLYIASSFETA
jgi:AcrR family transcriptional regulator